MMIYNIFLTTKGKDSIKLNTNKCSLKQLG
jgi:hypothetical protein